jgi:hypothetical protein
MILHPPSELALSLGLSLRLSPYLALVFKAVAHAYPKATRYWLGGKSMVG